MSYKQKVFLKEFNKDEFAKFRKVYELINPDRPIETSNVKHEDTDPRFRKFLAGRMAPKMRSRQWVSNSMDSIIRRLS